MPPLAASAVSLRAYPSGGDVTIFDVDPTAYDPFNVAKRGSSHKVLSGSMVHQDFGVKTGDFVIAVRVPLTDHLTKQALWTKFITNGQLWELRDWFVNRFVVIFAPGQASFHAVPIIGSCTSYEVEITFYVIAVLEWHGGAYG